MKKNYTRIANRLYNETWVIDQPTLYSLHEQFENHIQNPVPMDDEDNKEEEEVYASSVPTIGIITINGIMGRHLSLMETLCGGVDIENVMAQFNKLSADPNVKAIACIINSPGGAVTGTPELAQLIAEVNAKIPVYMYSSGLMCSAAYWIGSQGTAIYSSLTARIGSIGVYNLLIDQTEKLAKEGTKVIPISAGKNKLIGAPFMVPTEEQISFIQSEIDDIYNKFKAAVGSKRPQINFEQVQALAYTGEAAVNNGLVDGIFNTANEFIAFVATLPDKQ